MEEIAQAVLGTAAHVRAGRQRRAHRTLQEALKGAVSIPHQCWAAVRLQLGTQICHVGAGAATPAKARGRR
jgi:hypothetical protein